MALTAWQLGMADTARARMQDAIGLADRTRKPYGLARSSFYAAYLHALLRDPEAAQRYAEKAFEYSTEYSIPLYLDASRMVYGWAIAQQGRCTEGVAFSRAAVESYKAAGNRVAIGSFLGSWRRRCGAQAYPTRQWRRWNKASAWRRENLWTFPIYGGSKESCFSKTLLLDQLRNSFRRPSRGLKRQRSVFARGSPWRRTSAPKPTNFALRPAWADCSRQAADRLKHERSSNRF